MSNRGVYTYPQADRRAYLWLALGALLVIFSVGRWRFPLAAWLAPIFLLRFMRTQRPGRGYGLLLLAVILPFIIAWYGIVGQNGVPIGTISTVMISVPYLLDRLLVGRFRGFATTLVYPIAASAWGFITLSYSPVTTYGAWEYSQFANDYLLQLVSITGMYGVGFLIYWFAGLVNWAWQEQFDWLAIRRGLAVYGAVMAAVLTFGFVRLTFFQPAEGTVRIAGIVPVDVTHAMFREQADLLNEDEAAFRWETAVINDLYIEATILEAQRGAKIIVWSENAAFGVPAAIDALVQRVQTVAREHNVYVVMGTLAASPGYESLYADTRLQVVDPSGAVVINQLKYGCSELALNAVRLQTIDTPYGRLAGVICCDLDFPRVVDQISARGVDILFVPSDEPSLQDTIAHAQHVPFRAIENGVSIFRIADQGVSLATDPYGRVLAQMNHYVGGERTMVAQVPTSRVFTLYSVTGENVGWLFVAAFVVLLGWVARQWQRARLVEPQPRERPAPSH